MFAINNDYHESLRKYALDILAFVLNIYCTNTKCFKVVHETMIRCVSREIQTGSLPFDPAL